jgi:hypothetical protein
VSFNPTDEELKDWREHPVTKFMLHVKLPELEGLMLKRAVDDRENRDATCDQVAGIAISKDFLMNYLEE